MNFMADFNDHIIDTVKSNCFDWFNSNMNVELIDEYYVNPLKYDKEYGYLIKINNGEHDIDENGKYNMTIDVKGLRFLKQKYNIEWCISNIDISDDIDFKLDDNDFSEVSEEDIPAPIHDDIIELRERYTVTLQEEINQAGEYIAALKANMDQLQKVKDELQEFDSVESFNTIEEKIDKLLVRNFLVSI